MRDYPYTIVDFFPHILIHSHHRSVCPSVSRHACSTVRHRHLLSNQNLEAKESNNDLDARVSYISMTWKSK